MIDNGEGREVHDHDFSGTPPNCEETASGAFSWLLGSVVPG
jgi:hypothetical protein